MGRRARVRARARSSKRGEGLARRSFDCGAAGRGRDDEPLMRPQFLPRGSARVTKIGESQTVDSQPLRNSRNGRRDCSHKAKATRRDLPPPQTGASDACPGPGASPSSSPSPFSRSSSSPSPPPRRGAARRPRTRRPRGRTTTPRVKSPSRRRSRRTPSSRGRRERASMARRRVTTARGEATRTRPPA